MNDSPGSDEDDGVVDGPRVPGGVQLAIALPDYPDLQRLIDDKLIDVLSDIQLRGLEEDACPD